MIARALSIPAGRRRVAAVALAAIIVAGCGRIGPLEPPPEANAPPKPALPSSADPLSPQAKPKIPPITPPNRSFFLDPLLK